MQTLKKLIFLSFSLLFSISFVACGYKPSTYYAKQEMDGNVFVKLRVALEDPQNSVLVKDAVNKILIQKLDSRMVNNPDNADVIMNLGISSVSIVALQYDKSGYNKLYGATVVIGVDYFRKENGIRKSFTVDGEYEFSVDDTTTITDTKRYDAISNAANKAMDEILSKIAVSSFKNK